jgi:lipopolysaccharide biosynthesis regulator YciM
LCEIAGNAIDSGNNRLARKSLDRALEVDSGSVRATLILIRLHLQTGNTGTAKGIFLRLIRQSPEYMALFIEPARQIYHSNESRAYQEFLQDQYQQHPSSQLAIALLEHYADDDEIGKAQQFLSDILNKSPSFEAFEFALRLRKSNPDQLDETWETLSTFLKTLQDKKTEYICSRCGYGSHTIQWLCPSCRNWASMKPEKT